MTLTASSQYLRKSSLLDIDEAFFDWFDKVLNLSVTDNKHKKRKVSVIMSGAERWAQVKNRNKKMRDKANTLILPIIAVRRLDFEKVQDSWALGRWFKTLSYAKVVNSYETANRANLNEARRRNNRVTINDMLEKAPVYEMIEIPYPSFVKVNYAVEIWTSYIIDMNIILEKIWAKTNDSAAGSNQIQVKSRSGNKYVCFTEQTATNASNIEDYSETERVVKSTLNFKVLGYLLDESDAAMTKSVPCVSTISMKERVVTDKEEIKKIFGK